MKRFLILLSFLAAPLFAAPFLTETFTAANGTALAGKAADVGGTWTAAGFGVSNGTITSNQFASASGTQNLYNNQVAGGQNYTVTWDGIRSASAGSTIDGYLGVRFDSSGKNGYIAGLNGNSSFVDMYKLSNGAPTAIAQQATSWFPNSGDVRHQQITVAKVGSTAVITFFLQRASDNLWMQTDGTFASTKVACLTYTDTSPIEPTNGGFVFTWIDPDSKVDNISASLDVVALTSSVLTPTATAAGVALSVTPAGGTAPYSVNFYRGTTAGFVANGGSLIGTSTGSFTDSTGTAGTLYFYRAVVSDSASQTLTTQTVAGVRRAASVAAVWIGDSNMAGANVSNATTQAPPVHGSNFIAARTNRVVAFSNNGIGGTTSANWISGSTNLNAAISSMAGLTGTTKVFFVSLGTNDIVSSVTAAAYKTNMLSLVAGLRASYPTAYIFLDSPIYTSPDANNGNLYANTDLIGQYKTKLSEIVAGASDSFLFLGDQTAWETTSNHTSDWYATETFASGAFSGQQFYLHLNDVGSKYWGEMQTVKLNALLNGETSGSVAVARGYTF